MNRWRVSSTALLSDSETDTWREDEAGRVTIVLIGLVAVVLGFVLVAANITAVHLQHRGLLNCVDRIAASAAQHVDAHSYYLGSAYTPLPLHEGGARAAAYQALDNFDNNICDIGWGVSIDSVSVQSTEIVVTVDSQATLPLIPDIVEGVVAPRLTVSGSALTQ